MIPIKNCGNCRFFQKLSGYAICQKYDYRTNSDHGRNCTGWKGIKYERKKDDNFLDE